MPLDPRFPTLCEHLERARCAMIANDDQIILEQLYHLREVAWSINSDILAARWEARQRNPLTRIPRTAVTVDDLMS